MKEKKTTIITVFGDSSAWGAFDTESGGWVERVKTYLFEKEIYVYNLGIESNTTNDLLRRFEDELKTRIHFPEYAECYNLIIIFEIGQNDSIYNKEGNLVGINKFKDNLNELIKKARKFTKDIIFLGLSRVDEKETIPWEESGESYDNKTIEKYNSVLEKVCKDKNISFIPLWDLLPKENLSDGLHPNTQGHEKIFEKVKGELNSFLEVN